MFRKSHKLSYSTPPSSAGIRNLCILCVLLLFMNNFRPASLMRVIVLDESTSKRLRIAHTFTSSFLQMWFILRTAAWLPHRMMLRQWPKNVDILIKMFHPEWVSPKERSWKTPLHRQKETVGHSEETCCWKGCRRGSKLILKSSNLWENQIFTVNKINMMSFVCNKIDTLASKHVLCCSVQNPWLLDNLLISSATNKRPASSAFKSSVGSAEIIQLDGCTKAGT